MMNGSHVGRVENLRPIINRPAGEFKGVLLTVQADYQSAAGCQPALQGQGTPWT
jgi:hypothetical protein